MVHYQSCYRLLHSDDMYIKVCYTSSCALTLLMKFVKILIGVLPGTYPEFCVQGKGERGGMPGSNLLNVYRLVHLNVK